MNSSVMLHFLNFYCVPPIKLIVKASQAKYYVLSPLYLGGILKHRDIAVNKAKIPRLKEPLRRMEAYIVPCNSHSMMCLISSGLRSKGITFFKF